MRDITKSPFFTPLVLLGIGLGLVATDLDSAFGNGPPAGRGPQTLPAKGNNGPPQALKFHPENILVRFKTGAQGNARIAARRAISAQVSHSFRKVPGLEVLRVPPGAVEQALRGLRNNPHVLYAEPDYIVHASDLPNDPGLPDLWGLRNIGQTVNADPGTAGADANVAAVWNAWTGDAGFRVAVIDTGVDYLHPDLVGNIWTNTGEIPGNGIDDDGNGWIDDVHGYDFTNNDPDPMDDNGHGTHVAGTIGAAGNNGVGVVGVNWRCKIVGLKFLNGSGSGVISDAVKAVEYAIANGIKLSNNSWGGGGFSQAMHDVIQASQTVQHLFVAAAGNESSNSDVVPAYPAGYELPNIISVAATDNDDALAAFSNYGAASVDIAAPGVQILSTFLEDGYKYLQGTSMATPHVTGAAALIYSRFPTVTWDAVKERLLSSARPVQSLSGKCLTGGALDAYDAFGDCNANGVLDEDELAGGAPDCSANGLLDECEPDCNVNGIVDSCEVFEGQAADCNGDEVPDTCQPDCNGNDLPDVCEIVDGLAVDCNGNNVPDACELEQGAPDCNGNNVPDSCDLASGFSKDCDYSQAPDECELDSDCNANGRPDICDIYTYLTSFDCNRNLVPDECETVPDCNGNGIGDVIELCLATAFDCNHNGKPDECDVGTDDWVDCDNNGVLDNCEFGIMVFLYSSPDNSAGLPEQDAHLPKSPLVETLEDAGFLIDMKNVSHPLNRPFDVVIRHSQSTFPEVDEDVFAGRMGMVFLDNWGEDIRGPIPSFPASPVASLSDGTDMSSDGPTYRSGTTLVDPASPLAKSLALQSDLRGASLTPQLKPGVNTVIKWKDGTPMAATHRYGQGRVVYLNDVSGWTGTGSWPGDEEYGKTLLKNAVLFASSTSKDCNLNKIMDSCEIRDGLLSDVLPIGGDGIPDECQSDCNGNGKPDRADIQAGASADCDNNGVPDECSAQRRDCNGNGIPDACDIAAGTSTDCYSVTSQNYVPANGIPDECEADCDADGITDLCRVASSPSQDCDLDFIPNSCDADSCQPRFRVFWRGITPSPLMSRVMKQVGAEVTLNFGATAPWPTDLTQYDVLVLSFMGVPGEPERQKAIDEAVAAGVNVVYLLQDKRAGHPSFDGEASPHFNLGMIDAVFHGARVVDSSCSIVQDLPLQATLIDFVGDVLLKPDSNVIMQWEEPQLGTRPFVVERRHGLGRVVWLNTFAMPWWPNNALHDRYYGNELFRNVLLYALGLSRPDCDKDGLFDEDEMDAQPALDLDGNRILDICDGAPQAAAGGFAMNRYIAFQTPEYPGFEGMPTALRLTMRSLHHPEPPNPACCPAPDFSSYEGQHRYVKLANNGTGVCIDSVAKNTTFRCAVLTCDPTEEGVYRDWAAELGGAPLYVTGKEIVPSSRYEVAQLPQSCWGSEPACQDASVVLELLTARWGDVGPDFQLPNPPIRQPNAQDIASQVDRVKDLPQARHKAMAQVNENDLNPAAPLTAVNVARVIDAVKGQPYPFAGPSPCP